MAVYERTWRRYAGPLTSLNLRFLVITRYALRDAFSSRLFTAFYALCFLPTLAGLFLVYLSHNSGLISRLGATEEFLSALTMTYMTVYMFIYQAVPAFFVAVIVTPNLIASDLSDNGLPLYLCRPINRRDYVVGKLAVVALLLSPVTWVGGLLVYLLQALMEGHGWWWDNLRIAGAYLIGHAVWVVAVSLQALAISAWARFKPAARGGLVGIFLLAGAVSGILNATTRSRWGDLLNPVQVIWVIVARLFDPATTTPVPAIAAWLSLITVSALSLLLIHRKVRAHEVVR
jgi:ABC-2 type transport system permease protein